MREDSGRFCRQLCTMLAVIVAAQGVLPATFGQSDQGGTLDAAFGAWSQRQEDIRTLRFVWTQILTVRKVGSIDEIDEEESPEDDSSPRPGDMVTLGQTITLTLDGDKLAYVVETEGAKAMHMPPFYKSTYDGNSSQMYAQIESQNPRLGTGTGVIRGEAHAFDVDSIQVRPLLLTYRAAHPALAQIDQSEYRVAPERGQIGDTSCLIIEHAGDQQPHKFYWVDPQRDYIVLREHETYRGVDRIRKDITYEHDPEHGWVPSGWTFVNLDENGQLRESATATVTEYALNGPIPASEFEIQYPRGTYLTDARSTPERSNWVGGNPGTAAASSPNRTMILLFNLIVAALLIACFTARRYIRKKGPAD